MTPEIKLASIADLEIILPLVRAFHEFEHLDITVVRFLQRALLFLIIPQQSTIDIKGGTRNVIRIR
jgi:hypothetical protein